MTKAILTFDNGYSIELNEFQDIRGLRQDGQIPTKLEVFSDEYNKISDFDDTAYSKQLLKWMFLPLHISLHPTKRESYFNGTSFKDSM
jgi:hypothetical protein